MHHIETDHNIDQKSMGRQKFSLIDEEEREEDEEEVDTVFDQIVSGNKLVLGIKKAKELKMNGEFTTAASKGFLKLLATEASKPIKLEDKQWTDWIGIMREMLSSSETLISSDSLKILTAMFQ